jgi:hypothetical protein
MAEIQVVVRVWGGIRKELNGVREDDLNLTAQPTQLF